MQTLGFIGGTGPQGRGLALRLAAAGHAVLLGSRDAGRAAKAVTKLRERAPGTALAVHGVTNDEAAQGADVVFVVVPHTAQGATLPPLARAVAGKIVVSCVNPMVFDDRGPHPVGVADGSAAEEGARLLPDARLVGAFQNISATRLLRYPDPVEADVLMCSDDDDAKADVAELAERIPGLRGVDAGPLRLARPIEDITAVLLSINRRYGTHAGLKISGLPAAPDE